MRPVCGNCVKSGKDCPYSSSQNASPSVASSSSPACQPTSQTRDAAGAVLLEPPTIVADMMQLQLLQHFMMEKNFQSLLSPVSNPPRRLTAGQIVEIASDCECLMTEVLAVSAMHLASVHSQQRPSHLGYSSRLHARAVMLFSSAEIESPNTRLLNVVFFSWLVGIRLLCDLTLTRTERSDMLSRFFGFVEVLRGVRLMTTTA